MRKLLFIIVILLGFQPLHAQLFSKEKIRNREDFDNQQWSWGYFLGLNTYDFKFEYSAEGKDITVNKKAGFNVGLIGNMRINEYLDLRLEPGVMFVDREVVFNEIEDPLWADQPARTVKSTYIHIPLLLKISTKRINNFKPFVETGLSASLNLSSNEKNPDDNYANEFRMKTNTFYWEVGFGIDLYLFYFKFTPSIRGVFALSDELVRDNRPDSEFTGNIDSMKSRGIFLNFKFQ